MNLKESRIVVDEREKKSGIPDLLKATGINVEIKMLPVGDYIVAPETIVERKTIRDMMSSIFEELIEFYFKKRNGNMEKKSGGTWFYGVISSVAIDFRIPIIYTPNALHSTKLLISMCTRKEIIKGPFLKKIKKSSDLERQQLIVLSSLPGVGEKTAIRMLEKFGTPLKVLSASTTDLSKITGLGEARAKKIKKILQAQNKHLKKTSQKTLHDS